MSGAAIAAVILAVLLAAAIAWVLLAQAGDSDHDTGELDRAADMAAQTWTKDGTGLL
jgi:hypothetical protein